MSEDDKPEWWKSNEELREYYELPPYTPPRFSDGEYTHNVVPELESRFECTIQFVGKNTSYPDKWDVLIDGEHRFSIPHRRDKNGNTVYDIPAPSFVERFEESIV